MFSLISKTIGFINQSIAAFGITAGVAVAFTNVVARYAFDASLYGQQNLQYFYSYGVLFLELLIVSKKMLILQ